MKNQEAKKITQMLLDTNLKAQAAIREQISYSLAAMEKEAARSRSLLAEGHDPLCSALYWIEGQINTMTKHRVELAKVAEAERALRLVLDGLQLGE